MIMAPEVYHMFDFGSSRKTYTSKADCWSLGVILYQLLNGHIPKRDAIMLGEVTGAMSEVISREAKDLIVGLLRRDPEKRLSADEALQHIWFQSDSEVITEAKNIIYKDNSKASVGRVDDIRSRLRPRKTPINYKV